jgi:hypothetical protein
MILIKFIKIYIYQKYEQKEAENNSHPNFGKYTAT